MSSLVRSFLPALATTLIMTGAATAALADGPRRGHHDDHVRSYPQRGHNGSEVTLETTASITFTAIIGPNRRGEYPTGDVTFRDGRDVLGTAPIEVVTDADGTLAAGHHFTCAINDADAVNCWGDNQYGQLGDGTGVSANVPTATQGLPGPVTQVVAGSYHACAIVDGGTVWCWGSNAEGKVGAPLGSRDVLAPIQVQGLPNAAIDLAAGEDHTCAVLETGAAYCWGANRYGQLGNGTENRSRTPRAVRGLASGVAQIEAEGNATCALMDDGTGSCWGDLTFGQLGSGAEIRALTPRTIGFADGIASLSMGSYHTCLLDDAGQAFCSGYNVSGSLGTGDRNDSLVFLQVPGLSGLTAIYAGDRSTCALAVMGQQYCWGSNEDGQLGDGTRTNKTSPIPVLTDQPAVTMAIGGGHVCALATDGAINCRGSGSNGQLGNGTNVGHSLVSVLVDGGPFEVRTTGAFATLTIDTLPSFNRSLRVTLDDDGNGRRRHGHDDHRDRRRRD